MYRLAAIVFLLSVGLVTAQPTSGPAAGSKAEPMKVHVVTGDRAGKEVEWVADRKDKPTVYVFVRADAFTRPMARFIRELDLELPKAEADAVVVAVWLTDDAAKSKEYLPKVQESIKLDKTAFAVFEGDKSGPNGWGINPDAHLTAVVVRDQKVQASFGYLSVNDKDVPAVVKAVKK